MDWFNWLTLGLDIFFFLLSAFMIGAVLGYRKGYQKGVDHEYPDSHRYMAGDQEDLHDEEEL